MSQGSTTYKIIQGLAQAAANVYDGVHDERFSLDGTERKIGLRREEGHPLLDKRVIDGFTVKFGGNKMCIHYQSEVKLKEIYAGGFESEVERMLNEIKKFLQKEYKVITGDSVTLTKSGEVKIHAASTSRVRSWVQAYQYYNISGIKSEAILQGSEGRTIEKSFKAFLELPSKAKKPQNVTRKND